MPAGSVGLMIDNNSANTSAYHAFKFKDKHFLLDIERSFLYSLTPAAYREIKPAAAGRAEVNPSFFQKLGAKIEWSSLKRRLKPLSEEFRQNEIQRYENMRTDLMGIWLGIAHVCNLACEYCFANEPAYLGKNKLMTRETALKGVDYLLDHCGGNNELSITFFGGEPLLNIPVIDAVVDYCREVEKTSEKRFAFSMTTNGTLLTRDVFEKLSSYGIHPMISLDGTPEIHNKFRPTRKGEPSWDMIVKNLHSIPDFGKYLFARATTVEDDTDLVGNLKCMQDVGFHWIRLAGLCPNSGIEKGAGEFRFDIWKKRYLELVDHVMKTASKIDEIPEAGLKADVISLRDRHRSHFCCGTGRYYYYLDPDGDLYPCFRLMTPDGREKIGTLDSPIDREKAKSFLQNNVLATQCYSCWARYLCGGPCFGDAFHIAGDYSTPNKEECRRRRFILECAAYLLDYFNNMDND